ncbi:hypothetical protein AVEN_156125-1 [Araneus ventricosus]|uniref:Uncharacterized protein n=1 Tax=Araneus ventricosus TaxID=182803 RepID=A0A4Y2N7E5_ARAVE|nr:hypothetical protein AVEN_156125-1 [Araneus ventricosus]
MKKTSVTGRTGCKQPGKKKAKERESSRLNVFIYSASGNSSSFRKLVHNYDEVGTTNIAACWSEARVEDSNPLHIPPPVSHPKVGDDNALYDRT